MMNSRPSIHFPCWAAYLKIQLIFSCKIFPKFRRCPFCLIGRIEIFLSFRIGDIINPSCHVGQLTLSDKWMSAYKHPPFSACAGFAVSRCIGTCLRTYPPVGGLPPARAKYAEHKRSLCDGCISLSNAEGLFLFNTIRLLIGLTLIFMGVSALLICPYPGCFFYDWQQMIYGTFFPSGKPYQSFFLRFCQFHVCQYLVHFLYLSASIS